MTPAATNLTVRLASGDALDVRDFFVYERLSGLYEVTVVALSGDPGLDFESAVGQPAEFSLSGGGGERRWAGICSGLGQLATDEQGLSSYRITIVPKLWLATQRRNYRIFQHRSEPDIVRAILAQWEIEPRLEIDGGDAYKTRKYRVQYGESDYAFVCRLLEDAGICFYFDPLDGRSTMVLSDAPQSNPPRERPLPFRDKPARGDREHATSVQVDRGISPGRYTMRDHDYRREPSYELAASAGGGAGVEQQLESYHYVPGAFLFGTSEGEQTPAADDKGKTRALEGEGQRLAARRLGAKRGPASRIRFSSNAVDLAPGVVVRIVDHPRRDVCADEGLLVVETSMAGTHESDWRVDCEVQSAAQPYHPPLTTPKPKALGAESATVVGPAGEEIHCDEFGRVRVQFHWDREGTMDDGSSCWIHAAQPWAGAGYGAINIPRVGQEVLVQFLGGDPDRPVVVGRVFTNLQKVPFKLPDHKTQSGWKSCSTQGTGGYNEIAFEDEAGEEFIRIQAERDYHKLVKHDEAVTIGNDRTTLVTANDRLTVNGNYSIQVNENERHVTGTNLKIEVGANRATEIAEADTTTVGKSYSLRIGDGAAGGTETTIQDGRIVLATGQGATITLEGNRITLEADTISLVAQSPIEAKPSIDEG